MVVGFIFAPLQNRSSVGGKSGFRRGKWEKDFFSYFFKKSLYGKIFFLSLQSQNERDGKRSRELGLNCKREDEA